MAMEAFGHAAGLGAFLDVVPLGFGHVGLCVVYSYSIADGGWAASQGVEGRVQLTAQGPTPYPWGTSFIRHTTSGSHPPDPPHRPAKNPNYCSNPVESHIYQPTPHGTLQVKEQNPRGR